MMIRHFTAIAVCIVVISIGGCARATSSSRSRSDQYSALKLPLTLTRRPDWMIAASAIRRIDAAGGATIVARYLNNPQTTIITGRNISPILRPWRVSFAFDARSLKAIRVALNAGLSARITRILYDPEHWIFTPRSQQVNVGASVREAAALAHGSNRQLIAAPATDLAKARTSGGSVATSFLRSNDLGQTAASADWVEIQAQGLERIPTKYAVYIKKAVRQIRGISQSVVIYAGLSTNPSGPMVTISELIADIRLTSHDVSGYWLNVPIQGNACPRCGAPRPELAIDLLEIVR